MTTTKEQADEDLRVITERNKIAQYAATFGCDERRQEAFIKVCGELLEWDGVQLLFKGVSGKTVAVDDPNAEGFFRREFDYLIPAKTERQVEHDPELIASAKGGNLTARGQLFRELHGSKHKSEEPETQKALDALLKGEAKQQQDDKPKHVALPGGTNPWAAENWSITKQGQVIKALGEVKAAQIAKAASSFIGATRPARAA